jgi:hypothetical protein
MANTFIKIASVAVGSGGSAAMSFTSIPATYTDLCIKISGRNLQTPDLTTYIDMIINGDTGAYYDQKNISGMFNSTISNQTWSNQNSFYLYQINATNSTASTFSNTELYIPNYTSTNSKSISVDGVAESNTATGNVRVMALSVGLYHPASNVAITAITLTANGGNFVQYSTATLYGIKNS